MKMNFAEELELELHPLSEPLIRAGIESVSQTVSDGFVKFSLENKKSGVTLQLVVSNRVGSISAFVGKIGCRTWSLEDYFKSKRCIEDYNRLFFNKSAKEYIQNLCDIIESDLHDVLSGDRWEDVCLPSRARRRWSVPVRDSGA